MRIIKKIFFNPLMIIGPFIIFKDPINKKLKKNLNFFLNK